MRIVMARFFGLILLALVVPGIVACGGNAQAQGDIASRKINVTTTVGMITDIVKNVGGERVNVTGLMGPGVDPHLYKPSARDIERLTDADIIFYGGLDLEGRMESVFEKLPQIGKPTFAVSEDIDRARLRKPIEFEGRYDPHLWFDVTLWQEAAKKVAKELANLDPTSRDYYLQNADAYLKELDALDQYVREQIATVPPGSRVLITAHDAFGYFGDEYGVEVRGLQGTSTATEAGAADVQTLARFLCDRKIKAIFVESSIPQATIHAVQEAARARGCEVSIGGSLFSDAMGNTGTPEGTYAGMVKYNVDTIVNALK
jgi:manganese/zinc/iron transport system substrate-binding protein